MEPERVLRAFLEIWHELPALTDEAWGDLRTEFETILDQLRRSHGHDRAPRILELARAIAPYPEARRRLRDRIEKPPHKVKSGQDGTNEEATVTWPELVEALGERLDGTGRRYTDVTSPERLTVGRRGTVTVALSRFPATDSVASEEVTVRLHEPVEVCLESRSDCLEVVDGAVLLIYPDEPPCVFFVRGKKPGRGELVLDFWQGGRFLRSLEWTIEVRVEETADDLRRLSPYSFPMRSSGVVPADLTIRVARRWEQERGETRLLFTLKLSDNATGPFTRVSKEGPPLPDKEDFQRLLTEKLQALVQRTPDAADDAGRFEKELEKLGHWLCRTFFTEAMMDAYRTVRHLRTVQIVSDESWIPWEWIKPYDDRDLEDVIDDDFLCLRFGLTRWLATSTGPPDRIQVPRAAFVSAGDLVETSERSFFRELAVERPDLEILDDLRLPEDLEELLEAGGLGLWHFAGPPPLDPDDVHGIRQTQLARDRPFIFLNVGGSALEGPFWKVSDEWSATFVGRGRCGAFLVCARSADEGPGSELASMFYRNLSLGRTFAQALRAARETLRSRTPHDLTWLSHSLYADPNGQLIWGGSP